MSTRLPVATSAQVRAEAGRLLRSRRGELVRSLVLHVLAAMAGLAGPWLLGTLVDDVRGGTTTTRVDTLVAILAAFVIAQTLLTRAARKASFVIGEGVFAELREAFLTRVLALPLSTVERAGTGDLVSRTTGDVDTMARTVRFAIPETVVALVTTALTLAAAVVASPLVALGCVVGAPLLTVATRWYLQRASAGYQWERASYATLNGTVTETVEGARTVEALGLADARIRRAEADLTETYAAERRTLFLRTVWFPAAEVAYFLPVVATLAWGGWLASVGHATVGQVTTVVLYMVQVVDPVDRLVSWLDEIQVGATSLARLVGVAQVPSDRSATGDKPADEHVRAADVRYAYREGHDVLHGVDLDVHPGERLAMVGPSGAGKSTLGRLLAGIHPPRTGVVEVGGVRLVDLALDRLRREVVLVTQEHHVFVGTVRDNLALAAPGASDDGLRARPGRCRRPALGRVPARRARHRRRLRRAPRRPGRGAADRARPDRSRRPAHARARRGDVAARPACRATPGTVAGVRARRPDRRRDRTPVAHRARRAPGGGDRGRPDHRARHARRARRRAGRLRGALGLVARPARARRALTSSHGRPVRRIARSARVIVFANRSKLMSPSGAMPCTRCTTIDCDSV